MEMKAEPTVGGRAGVRAARGGWGGREGVVGTVRAGAVASTYIYMALQKMLVVVVV